MRRKYLDQPLPALQTILAGREQQRDVGVVGAGEAVTHEEPRVRVLDGDALIVPDLARDGVGPRHDDAAGGRAERAVGGVEPCLDGGAVAPEAHGPRQPLLVPGDERHRLDQRVHLEGVALVVGVGEPEAVAELRDPVLHLDAGVHLHEVVPLALDDALEGGRGVESHGHAEALRLGLHALEDPEIALEHLRLRRLARAARLRDGVAQPFLGDGDLDQLLLVHLEGAVAPPERDAPLAVAEDLDLVVARLLDVQLEQHVLVVAHAGGLHLGEDLAHEPGDLGGVGEDALALAAAAADGLQAEAAARLLAQQALCLAPEGLAELVDRDQVDALRVRGLQHLRRQLRQRLRRIAERRHLESVRLRQARERGVVGALAEQRPHGRVVDAGRHRHVVLDRRALRLVLGAGRGLRVRARTDEGEPGVLERAHERGILGHEAVAGEHGVVAVLAADPDDVGDPLLALLLGGARVVGHRMHEPRVHDAELGGQRAREDDAVLLGEQHADLDHPHLAEDVDRLLADRAAADDQHLHVVAREGADPRRARLAQPAVAELVGVVAVGRARLGEPAIAILRRVEGTGRDGHQWNSRCGPTMGPGT